MTTQYEKEIEIIEKLYEINGLTPTIMKSKYEMEVCADAGGSWTNYVKVGETKENCTIKELLEEQGLEKTLKNFSEQLLNKGLEPIKKSLGLK